jgi:hypothetical protein
MSAKRKPRPVKAKKVKTVRVEGVWLLTDEERARLEREAASGKPVAMLRARIRLSSDTARRATVERRRREGGSRVGDVEVTASGVAGPGGGRSRARAVPVEYRATTAQVAGLWPWAVGANAPLVGTPIGPHLRTGVPVCFAPLNWFGEGFITAPGLFVLGLNGFGKSSLVRRLVIGALAQGVKPLILADVKPDYRAVIEGVGGQVIDLGYGHGTINPLDPGVLGQAVLRLEEGGKHETAEKLRRELHARQETLVAALIELVRGERVRDYEETVLATAIRMLFTPESDGGYGYTMTSAPTLSDLTEVLSTGGAADADGEFDPQYMTDLQRAVAADSEQEYRETTKRLRRSLHALIIGPFGKVFDGQTTQPLDLNSVGVCVDVSSIPSGDKKLKAAVMLASWSAGFAAVEAHNILATEGLEEQQLFQVVMDELWQVLSLGEFMGERVDELSRLQRTIACELIMISHSLADVGNAVGLLERCPVKAFFALPPAELDRLKSQIGFTQYERELVTGWAAAQSLIGDRRRDRATTGEAQAIPAPVGAGKCLLKIGQDGTPGIPVYVSQPKTEREWGIHATSSRFAGLGQRERSGEGDAA